MKPVVDDNMLTFLRHPFVSTEDARGVINDLLTAAYLQGRIDVTIRSNGATEARKTPQSERPEAQS